MISRIEQCDLCELFALYLRSLDYWQTIVLPPKKTMSKLHLDGAKPQRKTHNLTYAWV